MHVRMIHATFPGSEMVSVIYKTHHNAYVYNTCISAQHL